MSFDEVEFERALEPLLRLVGESPTISQQDLLDRIEDVVAAAVDVLGVQSVGLILLDEHDRPRVAAASDGAARMMEDAQAEAGEGPGIDTQRTGETVAIDDMWAEGRYSRLGTLVDKGRVGAVLSSPIRVQESVVGNLNAMAAEPRAWSPVQQRANNAYADVIGLALRISARAAQAQDEVRQLRAQLTLSGGQEGMGEVR